MMNHDPMTLYPSGCMLYINIAAGTYRPRFFRCMFFSDNICTQWTIKQNSTVMENRDLSALPNWHENPRGRCSPSLICVQLDLFLEKLKRAYSILWKPSRTGRPSIHPSLFILVQFTYITLHSKLNCCLNSNSDSGIQLKFERLATLLHLLVKAPLLTHKTSGCTTKLLLYSSLVIL